jgi:hypothetical protein
MINAVLRFFSMTLHFVSHTSILVVQCILRSNSVHVRSPCPAARLEQHPVIALRIRSFVDVGCLDAVNPLK